MCAEKLPEGLSKAIKYLLKLMIIDHVEPSDRSVSSKALNLVYVLIIFV